MKQTVAKKQQNTNGFVFAAIDDKIRNFQLPVDEDAESYAEYYRELCESTV